MTIVFAQIVSENLIQKQENNRNFDISKNQQSTDEQAKVEEYALM